MAADSPIEAILYNYNTWLTANVPTYLTAISAERADGIVLPVPVKYEISDADPWGHTSYPVVLTFPTEVIVERDIDSGHDEINLSAETLVAISEGSPSEGTKRILRYIEAIRELIRDARQMGGLVDMISTAKVVYFPMGPEDAGIRIATIGFNVRKTVNRY
jgi:hypothetical protein